MKKIYVIIVAMLLLSGAYAQTTNAVYPAGTKYHRPLNSPNQNLYPRNSSHEKDLNGVTVDYYFADSVNATGNPNSGFYYSDAYGATGNEPSFMWDMNSNYKLSAHDTSFTYIIVAFDSLVDPFVNGLTWPNAAYDYSNVTGVTIDSIFIQGGQQNLSGIDDTLICQIINVTNAAGNLGAAGYPDTTTPILFSDTMYIPASNSLSLANTGNNNWLYSSFINFNNTSSTFPHTLPSGVKKYAVRLKYYGAKADTFGVLAGYPWVQHCGTSTAAAALLTSYDTIVPNSMAFYTRFDSLIPSGHGYLIYYDCNNSGSFDAGDGLWYNQDFRVISFLDLTGSLGILENKSLGIKLFQNMPNPFNNTTDIAYQLGNRANEVTLNVTDLAGRILTSVNEGGKDAGKYNITLDSKNLAAGVYFYTLTVDGTKLTNKMIITK
jgi:hypothetical protein